MIMNRIERALQFAVDQTLVRLVRYVVLRVNPKREPHEQVFDIVARKAACRSAEYIESHLEGALLFPTREPLWDHALAHAKIDGLFAEFGVFDGYSINYIAGVIASGGKTIHGFDSFEGLNEDWSGTWYRARHFDRGGRMPAVPNNVRLEKGWFDATLPHFLAAHPGELFAFVHCDADTYESTSLVLSLLGDRIVPGTVLVFDEYLGFPNWPKGEHRAWAEFVAARGLKYRYLAFANTQAAVQVILTAPRPAVPISPT